MNDNDTGTDMSICWWIWTGDEWAEDPMKPHECVAGGICSPPAQGGAYIGQEEITDCEGP